MPGAGVWPTMPEYTAALENPKICFGDGELSRCRVITDARGRPLVYAGNFAAVYKVSLDGNEFAVRCFTSPVTDQQNRYTELGSFLQAAQPPHFVGFEYLNDGIIVGGARYPLIKMEWADGERLDKFVENSLADPQRIKSLLTEWRGLLGTLRILGIAHNSLQHGDVLVTSNGLRLVDYDAAYLPSYKGQPSPEGGHSSYQHPLRKLDDFGEGIDNFPALVIYLSLLAVGADPSLWGRFNSGGNLILKREDYRAPSNSECLQALKESSDETVRILAGYLEQYCPMPVEQVPDMETIIAAADSGHGDVPVIAGHEAPSNATPEEPPPAAAPTTPVQSPAAQMPEVAPAPGDAGATQAASGANPAFRGRASGNFRPRLSTVASPSAPPASPAPTAVSATPAAPAAEPEEKGDAAAPAPAAAPMAAPSFSVVPASPDQDQNAGHVFVIIADGSQSDATDVAAILSTAASALAASAAGMADSGNADVGAGSVPVVVVVVNRESTAI